MSDSEATSSDSEMDNLVVASSDEEQVEDVGEDVGEVVSDQNESSENEEENTDSDSDAAPEEENSTKPAKSPKKKHSRTVEHKTLYVQFPCKLPVGTKETIEDLSKDIVRCRLPRQRKARFCFVDCTSEKAAETVETLLKSTEVLGYKLLVNRNRKIDDPAYKKKLKEKSIERKLAKKEAKRLKRELNREKAPKGPRTNKIVVTNIPDGAGEKEVKSVFPTCVEFGYREQPKKMAFVTFASAQEATTVIRKKAKIGDTELLVRAQRIFQRRKKNLEMKTDEVENPPKTVEKKKTKSDQKPKIGKNAQKKNGPKKPNFKAKTNQKPKINYVALKKGIA